MNRNWWQDFKSNFFGSRGVVFPYIGINVIIFVVVSLASLVSAFSGQKGMIDVLVQQYFSFPATSNLWLTRFYTVLTYQFFHADFFHILFNMLWLYWMGRIFMDFLKPRQFHLVYIGGGIAGALFFALVFNIVPQFALMRGATLIGASASVMAVFAAVATLVPNYHLNLMLIGQIKLKYLFAIYIFLDLIATQNYDGGSIAHLGGALFGFGYIKILQSGTDLSTVFKPKPKMKVVKNDQPTKKDSTIVNQQEIDAILDKISKSGYDKLTRDEKETLFKASKN